MKSVVVENMGPQWNSEKRFQGPQTEDCRNPKPPETRQQIDIMPCADVVKP